MSLCLHIYVWLPYFIKNFIASISIFNMAILNTNIHVVLIRTKKNFFFGRIIFQMICTYICKHILVWCVSFFRNFFCFIYRIHFYHYFFLSDSYSIEFPSIHSQKYWSCSYWMLNKWCYIWSIYLWFLVGVKMLFAALKWAPIIEWDKIHLSDIAFSGVRERRWVWNSVFEPQTNHTL